MEENNEENNIDVEDSFYDASYTKKSNEAWKLMLDIMNRGDIKPSKENE